MLGGPDPFDADTSTSIVKNTDDGTYLESRRGVTEITGFDRDYVPVPWKAVPQVLRHIANEVKLIEAIGGKFSVGFEQPKKYGGAKGRIDRFPVTAGDIELAAYCVEYIQAELDRSVAERDQGLTYCIKEIDNIPEFLKDPEKGKSWIEIAEMDRLVYEPPIFMERQVTESGEEFIINPELLQKETTRWMMAFRASNSVGKDVHRNIHTFQKPFCDPPGQALMYISTLAKEVTIGGQTEWVPLEIPSVLMNRAEQNDTGSTLRNYHAVPHKYGTA